MDSVEMQKDRLYWGSYNYLYDSLTAEEIQLLEEAIFARRLGRYREALQIWDEKLPLPHTVPVLAIEKSELESRLMRHSVRLEILETFLACRAEWREVPSEQALNLVTIHAAGARLEARGSLHAALLEARAQKKCWQARPIEEMSLIEVRTSPLRPTSIESMPILIFH